MPRRVLIIKSVQTGASFSLFEGVLQTLITTEYESMVLLWDHFLPGGRGLLTPSGRCRPLSYATSAYEW